MTNPSVLLELAGKNHGVAADAAGLSSATPTEPVPVSSVSVSIPNAFTLDWRGEVAVAANEHGVSNDALNAAIYTWLAKISRWEAVNLDQVLEGMAREQQARMGLSMAMAAAIAAARDAQPSPASTPTPESI